MVIMTAIPYAILNSEGRCINITLWDGATEWHPPDGCTAVPDPDHQHQIWSEPERARDEQGRSRSDDPSTPDVDEAWVEVQR